MSTNQFDEARSNETNPDVAGYCELARPLIRSKVRRLAKRGVILKSETDDFEQEVLLRLIQRVSGTAPITCPPMVLVVTVVNQSIANQLRDQRAGKRDAPQEPNGHKVAINARDGEPAARLGYFRPEPREIAELGMDVESVVRELSEDQKLLCKGLGVHSISELARIFGTPRTTLNAQVTQLRRQFEKRGVRDCR